MTTPRFDWTGMAPYLAISVTAIALTAWQVRVDRSVFERFIGAMPPTVVMTAAVLAGGIALARLRHISDLAVIGPGRAGDALTIIAWAVPLLAAAAIGADLVFRFAEDTNVEMPDALRFYPAIAVLVECALHAVPVALLVEVFGAPQGVDATFWRIAIPVALVEAALQAGFATSAGTAAFSAVHLVVFGVAQVWMFWEFGFVWMLGFRLAYYLLWHVVWGAVRLELLF